MLFEHLLQISQCALAEKSGWGPRQWAVNGQGPSGDRQHQLGGWPVTARLWGTARRPQNKSHHWTRSCVKWERTDCGVQTRGVQVIWHYGEVRCQGWGKIARNVLSCNICSGHHPSWGNMQMVLKELFWPGEREKVISSKAELAQQAEGNRNPWLVNARTGMIPWTTGLHVKQEFKPWLKQYHHGEWKVNWTK